MNTRDKARQILQDWAKNKTDDTRGVLRRELQPEEYLILNDEYLILNDEWRIKNDGNDRWSPIPEDKVGAAVWAQAHNFLFRRRILRCNEDRRYRILDLGEILKETDEVKGFPDWQRIRSSDAGKELKNSLTQFRRRIEV